MSNSGHFTDEEKAMIREIAREVVKEVSPHITESIELKAWRGLGKVIMATGVVSAMATVLAKEALETMAKK